MSNKKSIQPTEHSSAAVIGPDTDTLKSKFRSQSIPLEQDFSDLIDMADIGRKALGQHPNQDGNPGGGLQTDSSGKLAIKSSTPFLTADENGLGLTLGYEFQLGNNDDLILKHSSTNSGLGSSAEEGLYINAGAGLVIDDNKLSITVGDELAISETSGNLIVNYSNTDSGLESSAERGLYINAGAGLVIDDNKLSITVGDELVISETTGHLIVNYSNTDSGLESSEERGLYINAGSGITITSNKLQVEAAAPFTVDSSGLGLKLGYGFDIPSVSNDLNLKVSDTDSGLEVTEDRGLYLNVGNGLKTENNKAVVDVGPGLTLADNKVQVDYYSILPKGSIVMFFGDVVPEGWALCDGTNGAPDLVSCIPCAGTLQVQGSLAGGIHVESGTPVMYIPFIMKM